MTERRTEKISAVLTPALRARLGAYAGRHGLSLSTAIAQLIEQAIDPAARREGYARGVIAASDALFGDLDALGHLDGLVIGHDQDGAAAVCKTCAMRGMGWARLADRTEFALDVADQATGQAPQ